ncbi:hypothetical protein CW304_04510 [Bacillus sp. UFRGS-B20]|nr:hypothetical protein CW304_04510 [Bacillus sp. UFRGS-B20]
MDPRNLSSPSPTVSLVIHLFVNTGLLKISRRNTGYFLYWKLNSIATLPWNRLLQYEYLSQQA